MTKDSLIHLRVPAATKARWVRVSRAAGMRLTDYIASAVEAKMQQHPTAHRRDPKVVSMFRPYLEGDEVRIGGQDWTVRQDMQGWYLTSTGYWRGQHPTIHGIKAMADLIREVEQAATAQPAGDAHAQGIVQHAE